MIAPEPKAESEIILRQPKPGDLGWVVARHAELYAQEYGWAENFEGVCAQIVADFASKYDPKLRTLLDRRDGRPECRLRVPGQGRRDGRAAAPAAGRSGRARTRARHAADRRMRSLRPRSAAIAGITLWTHSVLTAARHIYEQAGFRLTSSEKRKSFGQGTSSARYWDLKRAVSGRRTLRPSRPAPWRGAWSRRAAASARRNCRAGSGSRAGGRGFRPRRRGRRRANPAGRR